MKLIFGNEHEPMIAQGDSLKECLAKIKNYYIENIEKDIQFCNHMIIDVKEFSDEIEYTIPRINDYKDVIEEAKSDINKIIECKTITTLENLLIEVMGEDIKIVEEKWNTKK